MSTFFWVLLGITLLSTMYYALHLTGKEADPPTQKTNLQEKPSSDGHKESFGTTTEDVEDVEVASPNEIEKFTMSTPGNDMGPLITDSSQRANACIIILVRNFEANSLAQTLQEFEAKFNHRYHYPYVFLNNEPFSLNFRKTVEAAISSKAEYGLIPKEEWSIPPWINQTEAEIRRIRMEEAGVIYGGSLPYRHMCRYNSGFFFRHPLVMKYHFYWRVEPGVKFLCEMDFDPFVYMRDHKKKYSFVISFGEYEQTIPTLWQTINKYKQERALDPSFMNFFTKPTDNSYNLCHFWSNFEIGDLRFFRSKQYIDYFDYLDRAGGFFYERWGDAPVHSLAVGLFLKKSEVHFFNDIGYYHPPYMHCPVGGTFDEKCLCEGEDNGVAIDNQWYSCVPRWLETDPIKDESRIPDFVFSE
jgi:alpha 1,2-mannosyltransferase